MRSDFKRDVFLATLRAFLSAFAFVIAMLIATALICGLTGCADDGGMMVDENPPAPLQTRTYEMELDGGPWKAMKVYDATSGQSWWLLRRENTSNYVVLDVNSEAVAQNMG